MKIELVRTTDMAEQMRGILLGAADYPRYKFFQGIDHIELPKDFEDLGWVMDAFLIHVDHATAGYITWEMARSHDSVRRVGIILTRNYVDKGVGVVVLARWLKYAMEQRRFRRIEFACHMENEAAFKIYSQIEKIGGRLVGVAKKASRLRDGLYYDLATFEILLEDYKPTDFFNRIATGKWKKGE